MVNGEEDTATPPSGSPQKNLELQLGSQPLDLGMMFLSKDSKEKNTLRELIKVFEYSGSKRMAQIFER